MYILEARSFKSDFASTISRIIPSTLHVCVAADQSVPVNHSMAMYVPRELRETYGQEVTALDCPVTCSVVM